jgi:hypothetical protein
MTEEKGVYRPGQVVPANGTYRCAGAEGDHVFESGDATGHRFPPVPAGCTGNGWALARAVGQPEVPPAEE